MTTSQSDLTLRIICLDPPTAPNDPSSRFGLQDKAQQLTEGQLQSDESIAFTVRIKVKGTPGIAAPDFAGPFVHGPAQQRFLYISLGSRQGSEWRWLRRIKVPLSAITWEQIERTGSNGLLQVSVDGTKSGTVPLLGVGWVVKEN